MCPARHADNEATPCNWKFPKAKKVSCKKKEIVVCKKRKLWRLYRKWLKIHKNKIEYITECRMKWSLTQRRLEKFLHGCKRIMDDNWRWRHYGVIIVTLASPKIFWTTFSNEWGEEESEMVIGLTVGQIQKKIGFFFS